MYVEEQIGMLRRQEGRFPFGWLVCFEERPLQGIPPKGNGSHILFFSSAGKAQTFMADRKLYFGEEPLSAVGIDLPDTLKLLAMAQSGDLHYAAPPSGIIFDFDYSSRKARKVLSPVEVNRLSPEEIAQACGFVPSSPAMAPVVTLESKPEASLPQSSTPPSIPAPTPVSAPPPIPVPPQSSMPPSIPAPVQNTTPLSIPAPVQSSTPPSIPSPTQTSIPPSIPAPTSAPEQAPATYPQPGRKRPYTAVLITCGSLLVIGLLILVVGGVWYGIRRGIIAAPSIPGTPTAMHAPTAVPSVAPTPQAWDVKAVDYFDANTYGWPLGDNTGKYGSSHLSIQNQKLHWVMTDAQDNCWYWWVPDISSVSDFDMAVDIQRVAGSTTGDYGMIFRGNTAASSFYYFAIDDVDQKFAFFIYSGDQWTKITDWTYNAAIVPNQVNRIEVIGKGSGFLFSINGTPVGQAEDARLSSGQIGVFAELYQGGDSITLEYDNLVMYGNK